MLHFNVKLSLYFQILTYQIKRHYLRERVSLIIKRNGEKRGETAEKLSSARQTAQECQEAE